MRTGRNRKWVRRNCRFAQSGDFRQRDYPFAWMTACAREADELVEQGLLVEDEEENGLYYPNLEKLGLPRTPETEQWALSCEPRGRRQDRLIVEPDVLWEIINSPTEYAGVTTSHDARSALDKLVAAIRKSIGAPPDDPEKAGLDAWKDVIAKRVGWVRRNCRCAQSNWAEDAEQEAAELVAQGILVEDDLESQKYYPNLERLGLPSTPEARRWYLRFDEDPSGVNDYLWDVMVDPADENDVGEVIDTKFDVRDALETLAAEVRRAIGGQPSQPAREPSQAADPDPEGMDAWRDVIARRGPGIVRLASRCQRCGSEILGTAGFCADQTCPFSEHLQDCPAGWTGHPDYPAGECDCQQEGSDSPRMAVHEFIGELETLGFTWSESGPWQMHWERFRKDGNERVLVRVRGQLYVAPVVVRHDVAGKRNKRKTFLSFEEALDYVKRLVSKDWDPEGLEAWREIIQGWVGGTCKFAQSRGARDAEQFMDALRQMGLVPETGDEGSFYALYDDADPMGWRHAWMRVASDPNDPKCPAPGGKLAFPSDECGIYIGFFDQTGRPQGPAYQLERRDYDDALRYVRQEMSRHKPEDDGMEAWESIIKGAWVSRNCKFAQATDWSSFMRKLDELGFEMASTVVGPACMRWSGWSLGLPLVMVTNGKGAPPVEGEPVVVSEYEKPDFVKPYYDYEGTSYQYDDYGQALSKINEIMNEEEESMRRWEDVTKGSWVDKNCRFAQAGTDARRYRGYTIRYNPPPIPSRGSDWEFVHDDYDGAPDEPGGRPTDARAGTAGSLEEAKEMIDEIEEALAGEGAPRVDPVARMYDLSKKGPSMTPEENEELGRLIGEHGRPRFMANQGEAAMRKLAYVDKNGREFDGTVRGDGNDIFYIEDPTYVDNGEPVPDDVIEEWERDNWGEMHRTWMERMTDAAMDHDDFGREAGNSWVRRNCRFAQQAAMSAPDLLDELSKLGFYAEGTGGGCEAYVWYRDRNDPEGERVMVTDDDCGLPRDGEPATIGHYQDINDNDPRHMVSSDFGEILQKAREFVGMASAAKPPGRTLDNVLEELYDAHRQRDYERTKALLPEYERMTGRRRPGFMASSDKAMRKTALADMENDVIKRVELPDGNVVTLRKTRHNWGSGSGYAFVHEDPDGKVRHRSRPYGPKEEELASRAFEYYTRRKRKQLGPREVELSLTEEGDIPMDKVAGIYNFYGSSESGTWARTWGEEIPGDNAERIAQLTAQELANKYKEPVTILVRGQTNDLKYKEFEAKAQPAPKGPVMTQPGRMAAWVSGNCRFAKGNGKGDWVGDNCRFARTVTKDQAEETHETFEERNPKHPTKECIERMKDEPSIDDAGAFCAKIRDKAEGDTDWRGDDDKKKHDKD